MAIGYAYDEDQRLGLLVWVGTVTADDWRAWARQQITDPTMATARCLLGDIRRAKLSESIDQGVIDEIAQLWGKTRILAGTPVAIVADSGFWDASNLGRAMAPFGTSVIVFNALSTACTWLNIDLDAAQRRIATLAAELSEAGS